MNYRTVKCSDRLPEIKDGEEYSMRVATIQKVGGEILSKYYREKDKDFWLHHIETWLEPYELPTEEEIKDDLRKSVNWKYLQSVQWGDVLLEEDILPLLAKAITNLLKGER